MTRKLLFSTLILTLLVPAVVGASPFGGGEEAFARGQRGGSLFGPIPLARLARFLELTEDQVTAIRQIAEDTRDAGAPTRDELRTARTDLRTLLEGDSPDATTVGETVLAMHDLRQDLQDLRQGARDAALEELTDEQRDRLQDLLDRRGERPRRGARGAFGAAPEAAF
ncbi:MAG: Spy/CpxP family protein refolding chaperone [Acidobacteriota bacterium]